MSPAAAEIGTGQVDDSPTWRGLGATASYPITEYQGAGRVDYGVEAAGMELGKVSLQHPVEGECDVIEIYAVIERNVAADIDVQHQGSRENVFEAVRQLAKDPRHIS